MDNTELLLKEITEASGVSGYETEIRKIMANKMDGWLMKLNTIVWVP